MTPSTENPDDELLRRSVLQALSRSEPIRAVDLNSLRVEVRGSVVVLRGSVASEAHRFTAERIARGVPRVKDVVNDLTTDEELERRIALALASVEGARGHRIAVNVVGGVARLYGAVPTEEAAEAARGAALSVPRLVGVESKLRVLPPGTPAILTWQESVEGRPRKSDQS